MEWVRDLSVFFQVVLYIMGSAAALAAGVAAIVKLWKWMRKPQEENSAGIAELRKAIATNQAAIEKIFTLLEKDKKRLDWYDGNFKILYKSLWAMLDHAITGNSDEKMKAIRDELQAHIINT